MYRNDLLKRGEWKGERIDEAGWFDAAEERYPFVYF